MAFCTSCGTQVQAGGKFCVNCGAPIASLSPVTAPIAKALPQASNSLPSALASAQRRVLKPDVRVALASTIFVVPQHWLSALEKLLNSVAATPLDIVITSYQDERKETRQIGTDRMQRQVSASLRSHASRAKYVCLIGLWSDIPPYQFKNPAANLGGGGDSDSHCLTDAPYGCIRAVNSAADAIPDVPVGRIPSLNPEVVASSLFDAPEWRDAKSAFLFGVTAECWTDATREIVKRFVGGNAAPNLVEPHVGIRPQSILTSPDWGIEELEGNISSATIEKGSVLLFNVHGCADEPGWYGEGLFGNGVRIFEPGVITSFNDSVLLTEACYGGAMGYDSESVVEHFFENGGKAFVGCSVIAYGSPYANICCADILALECLQAMKNGETLGHALTLAKYEVLVSDPRAQAMNDKTVLSFNLFGAPWHRLKQAAPASFASSLPERSSGSAIDRVRARLGGSSNEPNENSSLSQIRENYLSRLKMPQRQFMLSQAEARSTMLRFANSGQAQESLSQWGIDIDDCDLEFFSFDDFEGYQLSGHSKRADSSRIVSLTLDGSGNVLRTMTSKG